MMEASESLLMPPAPTIRCADKCAGSDDRGMPVIDIAARFSHRAICTFGRWSEWRDSAARVHRAVAVCASSPLWWKKRETRERTPVSKRVTLTFDNGPTPAVTAGVLEALARRGIGATFFVIGNKLADPGAMALMRDCHAAGHWIGNHTFTHSVALGDEPDAAVAVREIEDTQSRIGAYAHPDKLFRPYGKSGRLGRHLLSHAALTLLLERRYCCVVWTSVPRDWCDPSGWVDRCVADVKSADWSVVVLHDVPGACSARLDDLLSRLDDLGVVYHQDFPDSVILTRGGREVCRSAPFLGEG
jgi:peptidoglycan-N-acetylglucosamine deacetylase